MLLMNGTALPEPREMTVSCLPGAGGGIRRELRALWQQLPLPQVAAILGPCAASVNLTFSDPVSGQRQTLPMALERCEAVVASELPAGTVYARLELQLAEP